MEQWNGEWGKKTCKPGRRGNTPLTPAVGGGRRSFAIFRFLTHRTRASVDSFPNFASCKCLYSTSFRFLAYRRVSSDVKGAYIHSGNAENAYVRISVSRVCRACVLGQRVKEGEGASTTAGSSNITANRRGITTTTDGSNARSSSWCLRGSWSFARENSVASRFPGSRRHLSSCRSRGNCVLARRTLSHLHLGLILRPRAPPLVYICVNYPCVPILLLLYYHYSQSCYGFLYYSSCEKFRSHDPLEG